MTGLLFEDSTSGIENRSISTDSFPTNETFGLNCTTIECFGKRETERERATKLIEQMRNKRNISSLIFSRFCLDRAPRVINSPWFIGLIVSLIVLMIVIAIVCGILKRKGGKYSGNFFSFGFSFESKFLDFIVKEVTQVSTSPNLHDRRVSRFLFSIEDVETLRTSSSFSSS